MTGVCWDSYFVLRGPIALNLAQSKTRWRKQTRPEGISSTQILRRRDESAEGGGSSIYFFASCWVFHVSKTTVSYVTLQIAGNCSTHRPDHRYSRHDLSIIQCRQVADLYNLYDLPHVARWKPYTLHLLCTCVLGWICTIQMLHTTTHNGRLASR